MNLKALALRVLQGNQQGNPEETKSFLGAQKEGEKFPTKFPSTDTTKWHEATGGAERLSENQQRTESPPFCTGWRCIRYEEIDLPGLGMTPGCIIRGANYETWRRLDKIEKACGSCRIIRN